MGHLQDAKGALVTHAQKAIYAEFEHSRFFVSGKFTHILQDEKLWPIEVAIVQVGGDQDIFHLCILTAFVHVHLTESLKTKFKAFQVSLTNTYLTGRSTTEQLHLPFRWDFLSQKDGFLPTLFSPFKQILAVLSEHCCFWIVFLKSLGCCWVFLHRPLAVNYSSLLEPLREAPTPREYVKTGKPLNFRETRRLARYSRQSCGVRNVLKLLGACIKPLQGLVSRVDIWTHLLEEEPFRSVLTPVLDLFNVSTKRVKLQEARVSNFSEVNVHILRGAIHQADMTLCHTIQTKVSVF